jgi:hypothetical protein
VGSLVDYPRRHCGQNPIGIHECFDDVNFIKRSRVFLFRGVWSSRVSPWILPSCPRCSRVLTNVCTSSVLLGATMLCDVINAVADFMVSAMQHLSLCYWES